MSGLCQSVAVQAASIQVSNLWKSYEAGTVAVLKGVDLEVHRGEAIALCGPSGCGKSTLLHLIGGLDMPDRGIVVVNGHDLSRTNLVHYMRHEVGFVFQLHNLIPGLTMRENCLLPAIAAGTHQRVAEARLQQLAEQTNLSGRMNQPIQKLSGGERQRTAICRALMNSPRILLADEPTGSLDERTSGIVFELLLNLANTEGVTLVMATHDRGIAASCDRTLEMRDGRILDND